MSETLFLLLVLVIPALFAVMIPTLQSKAWAATLAFLVAVFGAVIIYRSLQRVSAFYDTSGLLAWWGGTCILVGILGFGARLATWQGTTPTLRLRVAAGLAVTAFAFFAGQVFEPLGGLLAGQ